MKDHIINWLFDTVLGRIVGICLIPIGIVFWICSSLVLGEDFFEWLNAKELMK